MISMCSLRSSIVMPELAGDLRHLVVLQQPQVLGDDLLGRRAFEAEMPQLQQRHSCRSRAATPIGSKPLHEPQRALDVGTGHGRNAVAVRAVFPDPIIAVSRRPRHWTAAQPSIAAIVATLTILALTNPVAATGVRRQRRCARRHLTTRLALLGRSPRATPVVPKRRSNGIRLAASCLRRRCLAACLQPSRCC